MKIRTLWEGEEDSNNMPWLVAAVDEYTIEEHSGLPDSYVEEMSENRRELVIEVPDAVVLKLFKPPVVKAEIVEEDET